MPSSQGARYGHWRRRSPSMRRTRFSFFTRQARRQTQGHCAWACGLSAGLAATSSIVFDLKAERSDVLFVVATPGG